MTELDLDNAQFEATARDLEAWLGAQAEQGVPELVLVGLLRGYADEIQDQGYVPRSWRNLNRASIDEPQSIKSTHR
ncbi:hypothetical protein VB773_19850 [Haloarculaceae archaeon H-GB2-1]|nr:hypothetical protein [Haloarculaceae archaeon H-GB1-1]MEA5409608.1 hypothetical protein [Haloarculaceae archaeon H-GB2-1]